MEMAKTILFLCNDLSYFAAHRNHVKRYVGTLGWHVNIAADAGAMPPKLWPQNFYPISIVRRSLSSLKDARAMFKIWQLLRDLKPDIVHAITIKPVLMVGFLMLLRVILCRPSIPAVLTFPGLGEVFRPVHCEPSFMVMLKRRVRKSLVKMAYRMLARLPNCIMTFENKEDCAYAIREFGVPAHRAVAIHGAGVDVEEFHAERSFAPALPLRIVFAARLLRSKGIFDFLDAVKLARGQGAQFTAQVAGIPDHGNPDSISQLEIEAISRTGMLEYLGFIDDMAQLLRETDIVVLPTSYREGLPRVLIEAAAAGCALLAYNTSGIADIVKHGSNGYVVQTGNIAELAKRMVQLVEAPARVHKMQKASLKLIQNGHFSERAVQKQFLNVYETAFTLNQAASPKSSPFGGE